MNWYIVPGIIAITLLSGLTNLGHAEGYLGSNKIQLAERDWNDREVRHATDNDHRSDNTLSRDQQITDRYQDKLNADRNAGKSREQIQEDEAVLRHAQGQTANAHRIDTQEDRQLRQASNRDQRYDRRNDEKRYDKNRQDYRRDNRDNDHDDR